MLIKALRNIVAKTVTVVAADVPNPDPALGYDQIGEAFEWDPAGTVRLWTVLEAEAHRVGITDLARYSLHNKIPVTAPAEPTDDPVVEEPAATASTEETEQAPPAPGTEEPPAENQEGEPETGEPSQ